MAGHTLWPYKLVTQIFEDAQATADERDGMEVILHTKTPVTGFERLRNANQHHRYPVCDASATDAGKFLKKADDPAHRRWKLLTPRGSISCNYIVHATNGYAAHLLPFLAGQEGNIAHQTGTDSEATTISSSQTEEFQHLFSQSSDFSHSILPRPKPRGMYGITPTRGQVGAVRSSVRAKDLGWRNSWDGGGGGWEYWFPRYQGLEETTNGSDIHKIKTGTDTRNENGTVQTENTRRRNPLIIFGGGRQNAGDNMESGETDDGILNEKVGRALREFLPHWFPGKFEGGEDAWEMEWVGRFFFAFIIVADCAHYILDWDNGVYEDRRSFCVHFRLPLHLFSLTDPTQSLA